MNDPSINKCRIPIIAMWTVLLLLLSPWCASALATDTAPQDSLMSRIQLKDGNSFVGKILETNQETVVMETQNYGRLTFQQSDISSIETVSSARVVKGNVWVDNPQAARYLWAPNGYGLKKGEGYYQNIWVLFNQASVGLTDNFSVGLGMMPLFLFSGTATPVWITPKFSAPIKDKLHVGGGALLATVIGEDVSFGIAYGLTTFGDRDKNLTLGMGWGFGEGQWASSPTITLSTLIRTGPKGYFVSENYYIDAGGDPLILFSAGGRRMINKFSLDFALAIPLGPVVDTFVAIPFLGFAVPFGKKL